MKKSIIYKLLIMLGSSPFIFILVSAIYNAINGWSFCLGSNCANDYGFQVFVDYIVLASFVYWPFYIVGLVLIIIGFILLKKK